MIDFFEDDCKKANLPNRQRHVRPNSSRTVRIIDEVHTAPSKNGEKVCIIRPMAILMRGDLVVNASLYRGKIYDVMEFTDNFERRFRIGLLTNDSIRYYQKRFIVFSD